MRVVISLSLILTILSGLTLSVMRSTPVAAATNNTINFQARLQTSTGSIVPDGYYNVQFKLYNASSAGTNLWTETYYDANGVTAGQDNRVRVQNGYLSVALGSQTGFPTTIDWDQQLWLTMNIGGVTQTATPTYDGEMNPRLALTAVPYAFRAGQLAKQTGANTSTLDFATQTGNRSILLPDESGTLCIQGSANCGFLTSASASGNYVQLQTASPGTQQTGNLNISGQGIFGNGLQVTSGGASIAGGLTSTGTLMVGGAVNQQISIAGGAGNHALEIGRTDGTSSTPFLDFHSGTTATDYDSRIIATGGSGSNGGGTLTLTAATTNVSGNLQVGGTQRISNAGVLSNITGYTQSSGTATFNQNAADQFKIQASQVPTTDMALISNSGQPVTTAGINGLQVDYFGGAAAVESSATRFNITPGATSGGVWNANRIVAGASAAGVTTNGIKLETATGSGTQNAIYATTGWTNIINYNGTSIINGTGVLQSAGLNGTYGNTLTFSNAGNSFSGSGANLTALNATNLASGTVAVARIGGSYTGITGTGALAAGSIASGFGTISTGNTITTTSSVTGNVVNSVTGYQFNGTAGSTTTCSGGQFLQNAVVQGGIVTGGTCAAAASASGVTTVGTIDSQTKNTNGGVISGTNIYFQTADGSNPGLVSTGTQTFAGAKTFSSQVTTSAGITNNNAGISNVGAVTGATTINGSGNVTIQAAGTNTMLVDTTGAGTVALGTVNAGTVNLGNASSTTSILSGATLNLGNNATSKAINIGATGSTVATTSVNIATSTGAAQSVTIGSSQGSSNVTLQAGTVTQTMTTAGINIQTGTNSSTALQVQNANGAPIFLVDTTATVNLLSYPGFETAASGVPVGWSAAGGATLTQNTDKTNTYFGLYSAQVVTGAAGRGLTTSAFTQTVPAGTYNVSFYAKLATGTTSVAGNLFTVTLNDGSAKTCTGSSIVLVNAANFQRITCSITTTGNLSSLSITQSDATLRTIYIDSVQLQTGNAPTPYQIGSIQLRGVVTNPASFTNTVDSSTAFQITNAAGMSLLTADTANARLLVGGGSTTYFPKLYFGDPGVTLNNAWIGEFGGTDSDRLQLQGRTGINATVGSSGTTAFKLDSTGNALFQVTADNAAAFQIQDTGGNAVLNVDTTTDTVQVSKIDALPGSGASAITTAQRVNSASGTAYGTAAYTPTTTFTPAANSVLVASVNAGENCTASTLAANGSDLTLSGGGLTWVPIIGDARVGGNGNCDVAVRSFYAVVGTTPPSNMQVTADAGAFSMYNYVVMVNEYGNVNTSSPVASAVTGDRISNADNETFSLTLGAAPLAGDMKIGVIAMQNQDPGSVSNNGYATPSGWTAYGGAMSTFGISAQFQQRTGTTTTSAEFALGDLRSPPNDTVYSAFVLKQATGTGGSITIGGSVANDVIIRPNTSFKVQDADSNLFISTQQGAFGERSVSIGQSDSIGATLVLGRRSSSGDPTGTNGAMYYNSNTNKFRCYEDDMWKNCVGVLNVVTLLASRTTNSTAINTTEAVAFSTAISGNSVSVGDTFRVTGYYTRAGTTASTAPAFRIRVGTNALTGEVPAVVTSAASTSVSGGMVTAQFTVRSIGTSGSIIGGMYSMHGPSGAAAAVAINNNTATVPQNTTIANQIALTAQSSVSGNTFTFNHVTIEKLSIQ